MSRISGLSVGPISRQNELGEAENAGAIRLAPKEMLNSIFVGFMISKTPLRFDQPNSHQFQDSNSCELFWKRLVLR